MFKYYDALLNRSGDALAGHFVRLFDAAGNQIDIYADESETPIISESGVANAAKSDSDGMVRFFVPSGDYDIRLYDASDTFLAAERAVPMVRGVTSAELLEDTTAASIGEVNEGNVQAALDAANTAIGERATIAALASSSGGEMVGVKQLGADAVTRTVESKLRETVSVKDFGAACDGVTDDAVPVQKCVDYCLSFTRARVMKIPGRCYVAAPIIIDRLVDTMISEFRIIGEGEGAGFYTDQPIKIIDTTFAAPTSPQSEFVTFEGVQFEASSSDLAAFVVSHKFLRMKFLNCFFRRIKVFDSPYYVQSWYFQNCNFRSWKGATFKNAGNMFDCDFKGCIWEFGEDGIECTTSGGYGLRIIGNLFEGSRRFFKQAGGYSTTIVGNYTEGNAEPDYTFTDPALGGTARAVVFHGNQMSQSHGLFNVALGDVRGFSSAGNYSNDKMFDLTGTRTGRIKSAGDYATTALWSDPQRALAVLPESLNSQERSITAHAGGGRVNATQLTKAVNIVTTVAATSDSVQLPATDMLLDSGTAAPAVARRIVVVNLGSNRLRVWASNADWTNFGTNLSWDVAPATSITIIQYGQGLMKSMTPIAAAQADSSAADVATMVSDFNGLLAKLRTAGLLAT